MGHWTAGQMISGGLSQWHLPLELWIVVNNCFRCCKWPWVLIIFGLGREGGRVGGWEGEVWSHRAWKWDNYQTDRTRNCFIQHWYQTLVQSSRWQCIGDKPPGNWMLLQQSAQEWEATVAVNWDRQVSCTDVTGSDDCSDKEQWHAPAFPAGH